MVEVDLQLFCINSWLAENQKTSPGTKIYKMADSTSHVFVAKLYQQCMTLLFYWSLIPSLNTFISGIALIINHL
jgi:hypothetical protein